ncbi:metallophosphoesterase family protein [Oceanihabitans sp. 2_MG-2023]|uniref:metallophosphoesterase family protein n=1 Tax=Oceanihabitans sp. 2_MG-2023 TaxID=3062661 RepID=UPI0026E31837|nr:metallophosphoesterase family protein [Oceanihabitans sp. 2_MG-2023]MDO6595396.1 metallophosphoesterase family protein [Oceanihabitans sp. 2_MG-2023]
MKHYRTLAIGDIHGGLKALEQLLSRIEITTDDAFIFLGDYVDGWSEAAQVIQFLIEFSKQNHCTFIKGNHDLWCEQWLETGSINQTWLIHGGKETIESYKTFSENDKKIHLQFFKNMRLCMLDDKQRLFLHAGFTSPHGIGREMNKATFYTDRTLWEMVLAMDKSITKNSLLYPNRLKHYFEIYIGHTPTTNFNLDVPTNAVNVWNVDTGVAFKGKLSALNIDTKAYFQSDPVYTLYPNEKGRNK